MLRRQSILVLFLSLALTAFPLAAKDEKPPDVEELKKVFTGEGPLKERAKAGAGLAFWAPETLAVVLDEMVEAGKPEDLDVIAKAAVLTKVRHVRLLLLYAASRYGEGATAAVLDKIDNDFPRETTRAAALLGWLGDAAAYDRLVELLRSENERAAVQAARALARVGNAKNASQLAEVSLTVDNRHVRTHLVWAVQDFLGRRKKAASTFGRFKGRKGSIGFRAKEALNVLLDEMTPAEKYKVKLGKVRSFFGKKGGVKPPSYRAPREHRERINEVLAAMAEKVPAYHHLICTAIDQIEISSGEWRFEVGRGAVNIRYSDIIKWNRDELIEYYLVRYATILFLAKMGDPSEGHRGWEEGMVDGWWYAMDHTLIAVNEDLGEFVKEFLKNPPW